MLENESAAASMRRNEKKWQTLASATKRRENEKSLYLPSTYIYYNEYTKIAIYVINEFIIKKLFFLCIGYKKLFFPHVSPIIRYYSLSRCVSIRTRFFEVFSDIRAQKCSQIRKYLLRFLLVLTKNPIKKIWKTQKVWKSGFFKA